MFELQLFIAPMEPWDPLGKAKSALGRWMGLKELVLFDRVLFIT